MFLSQYKHQNFTLQKVNKVFHTEFLPWHAGGKPAIMSVKQYGIQDTTLHFRYKYSQKINQHVSSLFNLYTFILFLPQII